MFAEVHDEARVADENVGDHEVSSKRVRVGDVEFNRAHHLPARLVSVIGALADGPDGGIASLLNERAKIPEWNAGATLEASTDAAAQSM